ncbi:hypothetical protein HYV85_04725 [Candidatus Woesearchaeota archaeon]|nr:hypothetical protein [Candidatus Woesearchaeota archaeon]
MTLVVPHGLGKVQRMPYALWGELREISSQDELVEFMQANEPMLGGFVAKRLSAGKAEALFSSGRIEKRQEAYYLAEVLKSVILRGGGSSLIGWALWSANGVPETRFERLPCGEAALNIAGIHVNVPVSYSIKVDECIMSRLEAATLMLHTILSAGQVKLLTRADYVFERDSVGNIVPCLVDVGESNLSFALSDALFDVFQKFAPAKMPALLSHYLEGALKAYGRPPKSAAVIAEDAKMIKDMPYEFAALSAGLERRVMRKGPAPSVVVTNVGELAKADSLKYDFVLRCFRSAAAADAFKVLLPEENASAEVPFVVDGLEFVSAYGKSRVREAVEQNRPQLAGLVKVPFSEVFELKEGSLEATIEQIFCSFLGKGTGDIVIKPAAKPVGASSIAFFYNVCNPYHLEQAGYNMAKLYRRGIRNIIVEESVGNGVAGGRKAEIRVFALGYNRDESA